MTYGEQDYSELEEKIGYHFKDRSYLDTAFTHKSFTNEYKKEVLSYERLEFLGDSILEFVSSKILYDKYPDKTEGELTRLRASLVCEYTLSQISQSLDYGRYLYLSRGENVTGGRERSSILCDLFESVLGAIYLDGGLKPAAEYVKRHLMTDIENKALFHDSKSILQEYVQKYGYNLIYKEVSVTGPDHAHTYTIQACMGEPGDEKEYESGTANTKKGAEQIAAHKTLIKLGFTGKEI
ncbi:MAG: ribonuclease III [Eubacterium sp.]|nr:ribonuclease III [Eubacterium sp.]